MKLIIGLGNIGREYQNTRHNIGFYILNLLSEDLNVTFKNNLKLKSQIAVTGELILVKSNNFMNLSGASVKAVVEYYKIEKSKILLIHDDIDQVVGSFKFVRSGGTGGHKGVLSIFEYLGIQEGALARLKIGVAPKIYNPSIHKAENFVLKKFSKEESKLLKEIYEGDLKKLILDFS